jgi:hypothetical protein
LTIKNAASKTKKPSKKTIGSAKYDIVERFKFVMLKYRKFMAKNNLKTVFYYCYT